MSSAMPLFQRSVRSARIEVIRAAALRAWGRDLRRLLCVISLALGMPNVMAQVCAAPGAEGAVTVTTVSVLNRYYPGTGSGGSGSTVGYDSNLSQGAGPPIAAGDLVLVMQMQDGTGGNNANSAAYSFPAVAAGKYEFARVRSLGTNLLYLTSNLTNTYIQNRSSTNNQTYQVIRVPQYSNLVINSGASIVPVPWSGTYGGVVAVDVAGTFTNNGRVDVSYAGFRGNAGLDLGGVSGASALTSSSYDRVRPDNYTAHGGKGEGTAGTPDQVLVVFSAPGVLLTSGSTSANGSVTNATVSSQSIATNNTYLSPQSPRSYSGGSRAAGSPGNAGGGGDDALPSTNGQNSGGGGGANFGAGGVGGLSFLTAQDIGGRGGNTAALSINNKLTMGGGGGSASGNNGYALDMSGGAGGGVIFIKAGTVAGTGALLANGQAGRSIPLLGSNCPANTYVGCVGAGGGGAGGVIVVLASSGTIASAQAAGGEGGDINGNTHGPGGGGGGGLIVRSSGVGLTANTVAGGIGGLANRGGATTDYGATAGAVGSSVTVSNTGLPTNAGGLPASCLPALITTKSTSTPAATTPITPPGTTTYSITVFNPVGRGDARAAVLYDPSLPGGSGTFATSPAPVVNFSTSPAVCALGTRTAVVNPAAGTSTALRVGTFNLPGGCTLTYTFTVNLAATMPNGTYQNSAVAYFLDPTDSSGVRTVTAALPPAANGISANTNFTTGGAVGGSNYNGDDIAATSDEIRVQRTANLQIMKTNGTTSVVAGTSTTYTVTVSNFGPADGSGALLRDPISPNLQCTTVTCAAASGGAACPSPSNVSMVNMQGTGIVLDTFPANSSLTFSIGCSVAADPV